MKRIYSRIPYILAILVMTVNSIQAQVGSAAFDPNCYFPRIGVPGEIDTIFGSHANQFLGAGILNLGPEPEDTFGRMYCNFDYDQIKDISYDSTFMSWPAFNLHKLHTIGNFLIPRYYQIVRFGHFRSPKYTDILCISGSIPPARIYWEDEQGNYDSSHYTMLLTAMKAKNAEDYSFMTPYTAHISSDTVDDIIYSVFINNTGSTKDSLYFLYFKGGENLRNPSKKSYSDSTITFDTLRDNGDNIRLINQGDFRGTGRNDLITSDYLRNLFFYRNDPPFSMSKFLNAIRLDTVYAQWQNPKVENSILGGSISIQAMSKPPEDSSQDFVKFFNTQYGSRAIQEYRIFRGGKDFGSHRWTADSASLVIHEPYYYDNQFNLLSFGSGIRDCGYMTGTHNRVLYIGATLDGGFYGYHFFYLLGDAADDKADMVIGAIPNDGEAGNQVDTIVGDNDKFQDIIMGLSVFGPGTIYLVHGSPRIPEITRNVLSGNSSNANNISVFPNPVTNGSCTLNLSSIDQQDLQIGIWDLLGRKVYYEQVYASFMREKHAIAIGLLPTGTYILEIQGKNFSKRIEIQVLK
jgi:hypothetical protein